MMNKYVLPPLPEPLCNLPTYCQDAIKQYTRSVLDDHLNEQDTAIEADRKRRGEPVAWVRNLTDPQPHCVTDLRYRTAADADAGVAYVPVFAHPQPTNPTIKDDEYAKA